MFNRALAAVAASSVLGFAALGSAQAALVVYDYSFVADTGATSPRTGFPNGDGNYGNLSGQFTVDDATDLIVAMTGTGPNIGTVTALAPPGTLLGAPPLSDNLFDVNQPHLTFGGVIFTSSLLGSLTLYNDSGAVQDYYIWNGVDDDFTTGTLSARRAAVTVPEPAGLALLASGLLGLVVARRGKSASRA